MKWAHAAVRAGTTIALALGCGACSQSPERSPASTQATQPANATAQTPAGGAAADSDGGLRVVGRVHAGGLAVVALEPREPRTFPPPADKAVMDQVGLTFGPELLLVRTGEPVEFRNNDDTLHNVNVKDDQTREQAFNVAIPTGAAYEYRFKRDGFYRVACDIHPAMAASIFAASTPYTAVAESDGSFAFDGVPAGPWRLTVFAGGRRLEKDVEVKSGVTEVDVE